MRPELLEAYWDVIRDEMSYKEAAERRYVNSGQVWKICKTSVILRSVGSLECLKMLWFFP